MSRSWTLFGAGTRPSNNKMQRTSHGQDGGSLLILVLDGHHGGGL
jgi:hypothetical protein